MKYVQINSAGEIVACYDDSVTDVSRFHGVTAITEAQWAESAASPLQWPALAATLLTVPPITPEARLAASKAAALVQVRALRAALFPTLAGLQSEALTRGNTADALAIANMQQGARDITQTNLSACTTRAQIDTAFLAAWLGLVAAAPASVKLAFAELKK